MTSGQIALTEAAYEELGRPAAVELLFDAERQRIGLRPASPENPNSYPVRQPKSLRMRYVGVKKFANLHGIDLSRKRCFAVFTEDGILVIDLLGKTYLPWYDRSG
jgi:hypothetical protein